MQRTYLNVAPEDKAEVQALGAHWDADSKRWYIDPGQPATGFARWLPDEEAIEPADDDMFTIVSDQANVAAATTPCQQCASNIEVICIHCNAGTASGEPLTHFTVSNVWAMDASLVEQLRPWPNFHRKGNRDGQVFANHCPVCGSLQDDLYLFSEPEQPFFDVPNASPSLIKLTPLVGTVCLSGDEHFQVD